MDLNFNVRERAYEKRGCGNLAAKCDTVCLILVILLTVTQKSLLQHV